ncbi:MAG: hypothetical protein M1475_07095 [Actinobacteria bacterium]|nr:hypothetical protein [Actinomycetota bacterium]MCL6088164.1 hypothetical protein [Actinomycetota bacterium]
MGTYSVFFLYIPIYLCESGMGQFDGESTLCGLINNSLTKGTRVSTGKWDPEVE